MAAADVAVLVWDLVNWNCLRSQPQAFTQTGYHMWLSICTAIAVLFEHVLCTP